MKRHHSKTAEPTGVPIAAFIGMPTSGKTKIGGYLAEELGWDFVDTDNCICDAYGAERLQTVVDELTRDEFAKLEERVAISTVKRLSHRTVIATGGSVVYSRKAMRAIKKRAHVIFLNPPFDVIAQRVAQRRHTNGGIVFKPGQTLYDIYVERMPLYAQWADETLDFDTSQDRRSIAKRLAERIQHDGLNGHAK